MSGPFVEASLPLSLLYSLGLPIYNRLDATVGCHQYSGKCWWVDLAGSLNS